MRVHLPPHFSFGQCPGSLRPPQLCGAFFFKGTLRLSAGELAAWADPPDDVSGDVYVDEDPAKSLHYPSDFAVFKPRADILLVGHAHAPGGKPQTGLQTRLTVGSFSKAVYVAGDATWQGGFGAPPTISGPQPFVRMPLGYEFAYGGPGFEHNPLGRGYRSDQVPNLRSSGRPPAGPGDPADPVGFGPIPPAWSQRHSLLGTYTANYLKERWPWFPADFDWGYFNTAPRDQQIDGYLRGDEEITLENLHAQHPVLKSRLPGVRVRCFLEDRLPRGERRFREVPLHLDTLWIDAATLKLVLVWRGTADVRTPKMREIDHVLVVAEPLTEGPCRAEEYRAQLAESAAPKVARPPAPSPRALGVQEELADLERQMKQMEKEFAELEKDLAAQEAQGRKLVDRELTRLQSEGAAPTGAATASLSAVAAQLADRIVHMKQTNPEAAQQLARVDLNELRGIEQELVAFDQEMKQVEEELSPPARWTRDRVEAARAARQPLTGLDLAGLDLAGLDLAGCDFSGARLKGTNLRGAGLAGATFTAADLSGAVLEAADLTGANLDDADLTGAVLKDAQLTGLNLNRTTLTGLDLAGADLSGCQGRYANFTRARLAGTRFLQTNLPEADFSGSDLAGAVFAGAQLPSVRFLGVKAQGIDFSGANLEGLRADNGSDFSGGSFQQAQAVRAVFDTSVFDGADFSGAVMVAAQFEGASLKGSKFDRANLAHAMFDEANVRQALLTNANFLGASLEGADLVEAQVNGSNLYEARLWRAAVQRAEFNGTNLKGTLLG
jgi:uncharacterized protein YjbI with pentapeptide repeats